MDVGPVPRPHLRPAGRDAGRESADPVRQARSARGVPERRRVDRLRPDARRSRHGNEQARSSAADQHCQQLHRRVQRLRRHQRAARVAAHRSGGREHGEQRRDAHADAGRLSAAGRRARQRGDGAADGPDGSAHGDAVSGRRGRRRPCEREHRAHGRAHAVRTGAQPDRRAAAGVALERAEVPDRPPRRRRGGAVHHLQRVPPRPGRASRSVPGLRPAREREPHDRVRDRRLPHAQHGARRVRHRRSRRDIFGIAARDVRQRGDRRPDGGGRQRPAHRPADARLRQPGPAPADRRRSAPRRSRKRTAVQERRADRQHDAQRALPGPEAGKHATVRARRS